MRTEDKPAVRVSVSGLEHGFLKLLNQLSEEALQGGDLTALVRHFCCALRDFFGFASVSCWQSLSPDELLAVAAEGEGADAVPGLRMRACEHETVARALQAAKPIYQNNASSPAAPGLPAEQSTIVCPLYGFGGPAGVMVCTHPEPDAFDDHFTSAISLVAALLSSAIQSASLGGSSEQRRRAELLVRCAR